MNPVITYFFRTLALFRKELLALVKDPSSRVLLFAPALLQALLFGYGATYDLTHVPYAVLDHSRGATATQLLARLDGTGVFERVATLTSSDQIAGVIDKGDALLVVSIPSDFEARLAANQQAPLQVILDLEEAVSRLPLADAPGGRRYTGDGAAMRQLLAQARAASIAWHGIAA